MRIIRSEKYDKVRYAGYDGNRRITQWLATPRDVENQFIGRVREGTVDPRGLDSKMRDQINKELEEYDVDIVLDDSMSPATQLAIALTKMQAAGIPHETRMRFAQIATITPQADTQWVLDAQKHV